MAPLVPGFGTAADCTELASVLGLLVVASVEAGAEGVSVVTTGLVVSGAAEVGAVGAAVAVTGGVTCSVRHSPWLPDVSTAETSTETLLVRCGQVTVALVSAVWNVAKPSPLTTYDLTATLSVLASHASAIVDSLLATTRRPDTAAGGLVSGVAVVELVGGAVHTGIFAVEGFEEGVAAADREMPASATRGTATMPLIARGTARTVAPIPSAAIRSTCQ